METEERGERDVAGAASVFSEGFHQRILHDLHIRSEMRKMDVICGDSGVQAHSGTGNKSEMTSDKQQVETSTFSRSVVAGC